MSNDKTRADLKAYFKKHAIPTEGQFADLIESTLNRVDDGIGTQSDGTLALQVTATDAYNKVLSLARKGEDPSWTLNLSQPREGAPAANGLGIGTGSGDAVTPRLFIDEDTGHIGIGTTGPGDRLDVNGAIRVRGGDIKDAGGTSRIRLTDNGNLDLFDAGGTSRITIADNGRLDLNEDGGSPALSIDAAGSVGIGTTGPGDTLDVNGNLRLRGGLVKDAGGTTRIHLPDNGNLSLRDMGGTARITLADNGRVGIGTTAPGDTLDVNGAIRVRGAEIKDAGGTSRIILSDNGHLDLLDAGGTPRIRIVDNGRLDLYEEGGAAALSIDTAGRVGIGPATPADTLDVNGAIRVRGGDIKDAGGTSRIRLTDNGNLDLFDAGGTSRITIADNGRLDLKEEGGSAALSIDTAGRVGIGTTAPGDTLDVNGAIRVRGAEIKDAGGTPRIILSDNGDLDLLDAGGTLRIRIVDNDRLNLYEEGGSVALSIDSAGRVGIGTATPADTLDVNGDLRVRGADIKDVGGTVRIRLTDNGNLDLFDAGGASRITIADNGRLDLKRDSGSTAITINTDGRVGVGYSNTTKLAKLTTRGFNTYRDGTVSVTKDSPNVVGTGTKFLSEAGVGDRITVVDAGAAIVTAIASDIALTVASPFTATHSDKRWIDYASLFRADDYGSNAKFLITYNGRVGIGTLDPGSDLLDVRGRCYSSGGWQTTNADYAEYFENLDGEAIPVATPVVLAPEGKVRTAGKGEVPIGIVTNNSALVGNSYKEWPQKYLREETGRQIMEEIQEEIKIPKREKVSKQRQRVKRETVTEEVARPGVVLEGGKYIQREETEMVTREIEVPMFEEVDLYDASGETVIGRHRVPVMETYEEEIDVLDENGEPVLVGSGELVSLQRPKVNPEYDETKTYVPRGDRLEWCCVGLLGQLPLRKGEAVAPTWVKIRDVSEEVELWLVK